MIVLGIESSCDETSAAVVRMEDGKREILSNIVASQIEIHRLYGGVVPEIASRAHIEAISGVVREALGEDAVLEHHSNYVHPEEEGYGDESASLSYKLSTENWDATVIVTTSVQFFESLFDNRPSRCRKLHNISRSVVILDEVQMSIYMRSVMRAHAEFAEVV